MLNVNVLQVTHFLKVSVACVLIFSRDLERSRLSILHLSFVLGSFQ